MPPVSVTDLRENNVLDLFIHGEEAMGLAGDGKKAEDTSTTHREYHCTKLQLGSQKCRRLDAGCGFYRLDASL